MDETSCTQAFKILKTIWLSVVANDCSPEQNSGNNPIKLVWSVRFTFNTRRPIKRETSNNNSDPLTLSLIVGAKRIKSWRTEWADINEPNYREKKIRISKIKC